MRGRVLGLTALGVLMLSGDIGNAAVALCENDNGNGSIIWDRPGVDCNPFATLYTQDEVNKAIAAQAAAQSSSFVLQLNQLGSKTTQDEQQLKASLQTELVNKIGLVLTPALLKQIQDAAATDATNRVLTMLRAQGVIH